jgi:ankyrin repeat protein
MNATPRRLLVAALFAATLVSGCFLCPPPHSAYRSIHEYAKDGSAADVAADLDRTPSDLNLPDDMGMTALHIAALNCRIDVIRLLIARHAALDQKAQGGPTPLHLAAENGCADAINALLDASAAVNPRDDEGRTPLDRAVQWNKPDVVPLLQERGGIK